MTSAADLRSTSSATLAPPTPEGLEAGLQARGRGPYTPHIVAWNLTKRCNLACAHCYISAGSWHATDDELSTEECLRILDEILDVNPHPMLILTGGNHCSGKTSRRLLNTGHRLEQPSWLVPTGPG